MRKEIYGNEKKTENKKISVAHRKLHGNYKLTHEEDKELNYIINVNKELPTPRHDYYDENNIFKEYKSETPPRSNPEHIKERKTMFKK